MAILIELCCFMILFGFEIRYRTLFEEVSKLKIVADRLSEEIVSLKKEVSMKQNVYEEHNRPL